MLFEVVEIGETFFKMVSGILPTFHGPRAEFLLNIMGSIIDKKSRRINLEAYDAI